MVIDLMPVAASDGREIKVSCEIDFSGKCEYGALFDSPAKVEGKILNIGGQLEFSGKISVTPKFACDRCGKWYSDTLDISFFEVLKKEMDKMLDGDENPDIIFYEGNRLDISEIIYNNIYMNLPTKKLCKADCKGLCPMCGKDLNEGGCNCEKDDTDPRLSALDDFFKK